jgi:hypothetical protein
MTVASGFLAGFPEAGRFSSAFGVTATSAGAGPLFFMSSLSGVRVKRTFSDSENIRFEIGVDDAPTSNLPAGTGTGAAADAGLGDVGAIVRLTTTLS